MPSQKGSTKDQLLVRRSSTEGFRTRPESVSQWHLSSYICRRPCGMALTGTLPHRHTYLLTKHGIRHAYHMASRDISAPEACSIFLIFPEDRCDQSRPSQLSSVQFFGEGSPRARNVDNNWEGGGEDSKRKEELPKKSIRVQCTQSKRGLTLLVGRSFCGVEA